MNTKQARFLKELVSTLWPEINDSEAALLFAILRNVNDRALKKAEAMEKESQ